MVITHTPPERPQSRPTEATGVALHITNLTKVYGTGATAVNALRNVSVGFAEGAFTAIMGPSGSGKSTLMHCAAGLDSATSGEIRLGDVQLAALDDTGRTLLRRERIGFIFQSLNLLPAFTARQNILLPLELAGVKPDPTWFDQLIATLGLGERLEHRPSELSGGQQQRVAIARALLPRPDVVFADEPTGNLDRRSGQQVLATLQSMVRGYGQTVVMVTHDPAAAAWADRVLMLSDGRIVDDISAPTTERIISALTAVEDLA
jgi:putative ABC transport system ATP-binding protein